MRASRDYICKLELNLSDGGRLDGLAGIGHGVLLSRSLYEWFKTVEDSHKILNEIWMSSENVVVFARSHDADDVRRE